MQGAASGGREGVVIVLCVDVVGGSLVVADPQPVDSSACTAVLISGLEASQVGGIWQPLSTSDAVTIGSAIWLAWIVGFGFRVLIRQAGSLSSDGGEKE